MLKRYWRLTGFVIVMLLAGCSGIKYSQNITEQKVIPQVSVNIEYKEGGIYQLEVDNDLAGSIALQWNSSAYLNTSGGTIRLIHVENMDAFPESVPVEQESSLIAHGLKFKTYFVGESWMDYARRGVTPQPQDSEKKAMIFLAFIIDGKRVYWKGEVSFHSNNE